MWRRIRLVLAASAVLAAALAATAAPAHAATGELILTSPDGTTVVRDPSAGCISRTSEFTRVTNDLDTYVTVYTEFNCEGVGMVITPGITMPVGDAYSVLVPS